MTDVLRLQWIKSLRQFRTGVRVLHRLGALDQVCDEVGHLRTGLWTWRMVTAPDWGDPYWLTLLSTCIYEGRYTQELLRGFALSASVTVDSGLRRPTPAAVVYAMNAVLKNNRRLLKESFYNIHYSEVKSDDKRSSNYENTNNEQKEKARVLPVPRAMLSAEGIPRV